MSWFEGFLLKIKRAESPFYKKLRRLISGLLYANLPQPGLVKSLYRGLYSTYYYVRYGFYWILSLFFYEPCLRARCTTAGNKMHVWRLPDISGHAEIHVGNHVSFFGQLGVTSGRVFDNPRLLIGDHADIGHNVRISVNKEVIIEEEVNIASNVSIRDTDAHPRSADARAARLPPPADEVRPVRICRRAWLGEGVYIMKGVTVGEGATIGANSVVISDIPPYAVAIGNPARVIVKDSRVAPAPVPVSAPAVS